nr:Rrf2 family transcriptional regulator [Geothrix fuzhouensis]
MGISGFQSSHAINLTHSLRNTSLEPGAFFVKISARGRYSMQALFDLAHHSHGQPVPLHVIAERQKLSLPFLEQIFNKLKKAGVVASVRGPKGGYILTRPCNQVSVGEVLRLTDSSFYAVAKEDPKAANQALMADERMSLMLWNRLSDHISAFMEKVTFADLCSETSSNTCPDCTCPEYVKDVQGQIVRGERKACGVM